MDIGRGEARELARDELRSPSYDAEESLLDRALTWLDDVFPDIGGGGEGDLASSAFVAIVLALAVIAAATVVIRAGRMARRRGAVRSVFGDDKRTAAHYRTAAIAAAEHGDWHTAVVERFRAIIARAEERGVIDPRPGRTADEAARDAGHHLPQLMQRLSNAAALFDATLYGDHDADERAYLTLVSVDDDVRAARLTDAQPGPAEPQPAVPR